MLGPYCLRDFYTTHFRQWTNIFRIVNVVVLGQTKSENVSHPVAVRVLKTSVLKLPSIKSAHRKLTLRKIMRTGNKICGKLLGDLS